MNSDRTSELQPVIVNSISVLVDHCSNSVSLDCGLFDLLQCLSVKLKLK